MSASEVQMQYTRTDGRGIDIPPQAANSERSVVDKPHESEMLLSAYAIQQQPQMMTTTSKTTCEPRQDLLSEIAALKIEASRLQAEKDDVTESMHNIITELMEAQRNLQEKDQALRKIETDRKAQVLILMEGLTQQQAHHDRCVTELKATQASTSSKVPSQEAGHTLADEAERAKEKQDFQQLTVAHAEILAKLKAEEAKGEQSAQDLQQLKARLVKIEVDSINREEHAHQLGELKSSNTAEIADLRQKIEFFMKNSQTLSIQTRELRAENRRLKDWLEIKEKGIANKPTR